MEQDSAAVGAVAASRRRTGELPIQLHAALLLIEKGDAEVVVVVTMVMIMMIVVTMTRADGVGGEACVLHLVVFMYVFEGSGRL